jgi:hypothetical protein
MVASAIRILIREKLKDGCLPYDSILRIAKTQLVMEGIASKISDKKPVQFHVGCFQLWAHERCEALN